MGNDGAIAGIKVVATVEGRSDDRLAPAGPGFVSATDVVLTTWDSKTKVPTITNEVRADDPRPGPLVAEGGRVGWGAALIGGPVTGGPVSGGPVSGGPVSGGPVSGGPVTTNDSQVQAAVPELGEAAPRHFRLRLGAAALDGSQVLLYVERVETRAKAGRVPEPSGPRVRWVIADVGLTSVAFSQDEAITAAYWDGGTAVVGRPSSFVFWSLDGARTLMVEDGTAARSLVPIGQGRWVAGMASGQLVTFTEDGAEANVAAHSGPATALAYDRGSGSLASGGEDGTVLVRRRAGGRSEFDAGGSVEALTWASDGVLVAKIDGVDGRFLLMRPD
jgi:hypothetical protein